MPVGLFAVLYVKAIDPYDNAPEEDSSTGLAVATPVPLASEAVE